MSKRTLLICDDDPRNEERLADRLSKMPSVNEHFNVKTVEPRLFSQAIRCLEARRKWARDNTEDHVGTGDYDKLYCENSEDTDDLEEANALFDNTDLLIVDFDLINLSDAFSLTGEEVAYLARCYSRCGLIAALNQFEIGKSTFDLRLSNHPETFSDLNIPDLDLFNPGLWMNNWKGFRPWYWPLLPLSIDKYEARITELEDHLDDSILAFLGLDKEAEQLSRSVAQFIAQAGEPPEITFRDFLGKSRHGFRPKDKPFAEDTEARVAAARIAHWLEHVVLAGQDMLVDAPHLVSRYQSLLAGDPSKLEDWNRLARFNKPGQLGLKHELVDQHLFKRENWLSRPAWHWNALSNDPGVAEVRDPWDTPRQDVVFCEDVSAFHATIEAEEFVADLPTQFVRRFVKRLDQVEYTPAVRFAL